MSVFIFEIYFAVIFFCRILYATDAESVVYAVCFSCLYTVVLYLDRSEGGVADGEHENRGIYGGAHIDYRIFNRLARFKGVVERICKDCAKVDVVYTVARYDSVKIYFGFLRNGRRIFLGEYGVREMVSG